jgi:BlaI family transcriptional regulator, penicillinase repressor
MRTELPAPTERELEILKILWQVGPATVRQVFDAMRAREDLAQNTVQTFLRLMEDKGLVRHETQGRAFVYRALYTRDRTLSRFLQRVYDGSVDELVMNALRVGELSDAQIAALERMIRDARKRPRKSHRQ